MESKKLYAVIHSPGYPHCSTALMLSLFRMLPLQGGAIERKHCDARNVGVLAWPNKEVRAC